MRHALGAFVYTTEVVISEVSAGFRRRAAESFVGLDRWDEKHALPLFGQAMTAEVRGRLEKMVAAYESDLRAILSAIRIEVLPIPAVRHEVLVERATTRTPPCDKNGDGYRDTLNWLSIVHLVRTNDLVAWVTGDGDFVGDDDKLHESLNLEVRGIREEAEVRTLSSPSSLALELATRFADVVGVDLGSVQARLHLQTLA